MELKISTVYTKQRLLRFNDYFWKHACVRPETTMFSSGKKKGEAFRPDIYPIFHYECIRICSKQSTIELSSTM